MSDYKSEAVYVHDMLSRRVELLDQITEICKKANRDPKDVEIVAVSKSVDIDSVLVAKNVGYESFAENRPQELTRKIEGIKQENLKFFNKAHFDLIGNLQTNKINAVLGNVRLIHSVDSLKLAKNIAKRAARDELVQPILLQVNVSGEESKSGFSEDELMQASDALCDLEGVDIQGLMTMAPQGDLLEASRTFEKTRRLQDRLQSEVGERYILKHLSMGMSEDYPQAIQEGATLIRLGRVIFLQTDMAHFN